jgi:hypothetical protein
MTEATGGSIKLQFDTAVPKGGSTIPETETRTVICQGCSRPITSTYYDVSGRSTCAECRTRIGTMMETPTGVGPFLMATIFGIGAGIAGAIVYYGVIALTDFEIGIVAILIGWMVGYAVRKGAGGGGRRYQVLAIALTYFAVALAYTPIVVKGAIDASRARKTAAAAAAARPRGTDVEAAPQADVEAAPQVDIEAADAAPHRSPLVALLFLLGLIAALPVIVVIGGLPSGLISAAIIFFGMQQAWKMTGSSGLVITGPYRVGARPAASA